MQNRTRHIFFMVLVLMLTTTTEALSFGGASQEPDNVESEANAQQAKPYRYVDLAHVTVPLFYLPNGQSIDMNTNLPAIIDTEINNSRYFRTQNNSNSRLVITGGITSLELDALQLNLRVGWTPSGSLPVVGGPTVSGEVDFRLTTLSMDFKIYDRHTGETYLASWTNENLSNVAFTLRVDFNGLGAEIGAQFKSKLTNAIHEATADILENMENSKHFDSTPWESEILGVFEGTEATIAHGDRSGVKLNDVYSVYSACSENNDNCWERFMGDIRIVHVGPNTSEAVSYPSGEALRGVWQGDKVYIKPMR